MMSTKPRGSPEIIEILSDSEEDEGAVPSSARGAAAVPSPAAPTPARRPGRFRAQVSQQASAGKEVISEDESGGSSSFTSLTTSSGDKVENHRPKKKVTKKAIPPADDSTHAYPSSEHSKRGTLSLEDGSSASGTATSGSARNGSRTTAPTATGPSAPKKLGHEVLVHWEGISRPANFVHGVGPEVRTVEDENGDVTKEIWILVVWKNSPKTEWVPRSRVGIQDYGYTRSGELSICRSKRLKDAGTANFAGTPLQAMEAAPSSANVSNAIALDEDVEEQLVPIQDEVPTHAPNTQDDAAEALAKREATIAALVQELRDLHEIVQDQQSRLKRLEEMESKPPPSQTIDMSEQSMETENSVATSDSVKLPVRFARNPEQVTVVHHNANQGSKSEDFLKSVGGAVLEVGSKLLQVLLEDNSPARSNKGWSGVNDGAKSIHYKMVDNAFSWAGVLAKGSEEDLDLKEAKRQGEVLVEDLTRTIERLEGQSFDAKAELLFRLSFLKSVLPVVQRPHRDFAWDYIAGQGKRRGCRETKRAKKDHGASSAPEKAEKLPYLAFMPLTEEGMYLQVWVESPEEVSVENPANAHFVFIPFGQLLLLPGKTIHGGVSFDKDEPMLRLHFYLYLNGPPDTEYKNVYVNKAGLDLRQLFLSHPVTQDNVDSQAGP